MIIGSMNGILELDAGPWKKGADAAKHEVDGLEGHISKFSANIKASFGKRSGLGEMAEMAMGHGALAGLSALGEGLGRVIDKVGELNEKLRKGQITGGEYTSSLLESLPIVGSWYKLGEKINETITAQGRAYAEAARQAKELAKASTELAKAGHERKMQQDELVASMQKETREMQRKAEVDAIDDPTAKKIKAAQMEAEDKIEEIKAKVSKAGNEALNNALLDRMSKTTDPTISNMLVNQYKNQLAEQKHLREAADNEIFAINQDMNSKISTANKEAADRDAKAKVEADTKANNEILANLKKQKAAILKDVKDLKYESVHSEASRNTHMVALYAPAMASKMEQLGTSQLASLQSIEANIAKITGHGSNDDEAEANF